MNQWNDISCDLPSEGAAVGLLALMTGISEDCWCAGWMSGLEFALWDVSPGKKYGQGEITERQALLLKLLSEESNGWWYWTDDGPRFISRSEWAQRVGADA